MLVVSKRFHFASAEDQVFNFRVLMLREFQLFQSYETSNLIGTKQWRYYEFGQKVVPPLICLPGTADVYYKQVMALSMKSSGRFHEQMVNVCYEFPRLIILKRGHIWRDRSPLQHATTIQCSDNRAFANTKAEQNFADEHNASE